MLRGEPEILKHPGICLEKSLKNKILKQPGICLEKSPKNNVETVRIMQRREGSKSSWSSPKSTEDAIRIMQQAAQKIEETVQKSKKKAARKFSRKIAKTTSCNPTEFYAEFLGTDAATETTKSRANSTKSSAFKWGWVCIYTHFLKNYWADLARFFKLHFNFLI